MSGIMPRYYSALSSAERLMELEAFADDSLNGQRVDAENVYGKMKYIDVRNVDFRYEEDNPVLIDSSCRINKGDFVSITGMSGIGKSTLFKILLDIYPKSKGEAVIVTDNGEITVNGLTRTMFAYVLQGNMLFSGSVKDNLLFLTDRDKANDESISKALECACADSFIDTLPQGVDTVIGENGVGLSEGQVQRISVARAILSDAPILLLDEATSALDEPTEAKLLENLKHMTNKTCIIVTHRRKALDICNKHLVIENKSINEKDEV
jgi:ATP-binding cassette subfamily B protein